MRYARLTATLAFILFVVGTILIVVHPHQHTVSLQAANAESAGSVSPNVHFRWTEHLWLPPPPAPPTTVPQAVARAVTQPWPKAPKQAPVHGANTGDFASCVRMKESSNNYAYSGYYHGAYNMTIEHWGNYDGYPTPESAPPSVQDAKFQSDVAQGSGYMHQQYPVSSRACGG